jgi:3-oxoacyl-[acyl-carrier protein] reductase
MAQKKIERLEGKSALITGSSRGIGRAIAYRLAEAGANIVTHSRELERAREVANDITDNTSTAVPTCADVSNYHAVQDMIDVCIDEFGSIDIMVNNAGTSVVSPAEELDPEDWLQVINVNLTGVFYGAQIAGQRMIEQGEGGSILNISSIMGKMGLQGRLSYCAAKSGVDNLTRTLAIEWAEHGIYVNALAPGYIKTSMTDQAMNSADFDEEDIQRRTPLNRFGTVEEMAECALFLVKRDNFVTGEVLYADGGWTSYAWGSDGKRFRREN